MSGLEIAIASAAVSGVVGAVGQMQQASAASNAANYNAKLAERDAIVADQNRKHTLQLAEIDAEDKRRENRRVLATMRAAFGASGIELSGSPLEVLADTAQEQEVDAQRIEYEGRIRARDGALEMLGLRESAGVSRMRASSARTAGTIGAIGLLTGAAGSAGQTLVRAG